MPDARCPGCGEPMPAPKGRGRPPTWCGTKCQKRGTKLRGTKRAATLEATVETRGPIGRIVDLVREAQETVPGDPKQEPTAFAATRDLAQLRAAAIRVGRRVGAPVTKPETKAGRRRQTAAVGLAARGQLRRIR